MMIRFTMLSYLFFVSWTSAFAINQWILLPFVFVLVAVALVAIKLLLFGGVFNLGPYRVEDTLILLFLMMFTASGIVNLNESAQNYIFAYFFVFGVLYLFVKGVLFSHTTCRQVYMTNTWAVIFVGIFLSVNFILSITGIIDLQMMMPRLNYSKAGYFGFLKRGHAFSNEPGTVAFYLNTLGPLAMWYLWAEMKLHMLVKISLICLLVFGWIVTFSASGLAFLSVSVVISLLIMGVLHLKTNLNNRSTLKIGISMIVVLMLIVTISSSPNVRSYFYPIFLKLTLSPEVSSSNSRVNRWKAGVELAMENPFFGKGPRYFSSRGDSSTLSWYLMLLTESGFFSFILMMTFLGVVLIRIVQYRHPSRFPVLVGFVAGCGHLMVISTFFEPFLWLLIAIFYVRHARRISPIRLVN